MKKRLYSALLVIWVALWALFIARELIVKNCLYDYAVLLSASLEGKYAHVTGKRLYEFISFCKERLPENATYDLADIENDTLEQRRIIYYLYPRMQKDGADFLLVSNGSCDAGDRYLRFAELDDQRRILVKKKDF